MFLILKIILKENLSLGQLPTFIFLKGARKGGIKNEFFK